MARQHGLRRHGLLLWPLLLGVVALGLCAVGCTGQHIVLAPSSIVPAAGMQVSLGSDSNGNTIVLLKAKHLAPPTSLSPPANVYVVWVEATGQAPQRKALLRPDGGLSAQVRFVTIEQSFTLIVTAERSGLAAAPSRTVIVRTQVSRPN